ncbi:hypothetical protein LNO89_27235 [Klebsiella pneumoniae subsp. pneumoniae]|nr:hypothetical protein [Klebsiella pneumoniae subsp. pneumoniae]
MLSAESEETRNSRLKLALLTANPQAGSRYPRYRNRRAYVTKQPGESRVSFIRRLASGAPCSEVLA